MIIHKLIRASVESVLQYVDSRLKLILLKKNSRKHIEIKRVIKEEMEGVHDSATSAFIEK